MTTLLGQGFVIFGAVVYLLEGSGIVTGAAGNQHPRFVLLLLVLGAACASVSYFAQLWYHTRGLLNRIPPAPWYAIMSLIAISWIVPLVVAALIALNGPPPRMALSSFPDATTSLAIGAVTSELRFVPVSKPPRDYSTCVSPDHSTAWPC